MRVARVPSSVASASSSSSVCASRFSTRCPCWIAACPSAWRLGDRRKCRSCCRRSFALPGSPPHPSRNRSINLERPCRSPEGPHSTGARSWHGNPPEERKLDPHRPFGPDHSTRWVAILWVGGIFGRIRDFGSVVQYRRMPVSRGREPVRTKGVGLAVETALGCSATDPTVSQLRAAGAEFGVSLVEAECDRRWLILERYPAGVSASSFSVRSCLRIITRSPHARADRCSRASSPSPGRSTRSFTTSRHRASPSGTTV